jgi:23S rRNA (guanosine2251-2'-O)-methyltransferase
MKIAKVTNLSAALDELKKAGVWIAGADMQGTPMTEQNLKGAIALVIGNEGEGLGKLVREKCDFLVSIPIRGQIDSLNASVAAGILMFEKRRQDD